jgi:hypothetical protein
MASPLEIGILEEKSLLGKLRRVRGVSLKETDRSAWYKTVAGESCGLSQEEKGLERTAAQKYFSVGSFAKHCDSGDPAF